MSTPRSLLAVLALAVVPGAIAPVLTAAVSAGGLAIDGLVAAAILGVAGAFGLAVAVAIHRSLPAPSHPATAIPWAALAVTVVVLALGGIHLVIALGRPVLDWDGLYYHVPAVHGWWHAGGLAWLDHGPNVPFVNGYPMTLEVIGYLLARALDSDRGLDAWNLVTWPAAAAGLALTARLWGARTGFAALAAVSFLLVPGWMRGSTVAYVDAGLAGATCALVAATVWRLQRNDHVASALLWGAAAGLTTGVKGTGIVLAGLAFGLLLVDAFRRPGPQTRSAVRALVLGGVVWLVLGGFWHARALVHTGNPIHPVELKIGAKIVQPGIDAHAAADLALPADLERLPAPARPLAVWARPFAAVERHDTAQGLGPLWTFGALPALIVLVWTRRRRFDVVGPVVLLIAALVLQPAPWWSRLTLWMLAIGAPAAAVVADRLTARRPVVGALVVALVVGAAAWTTARTVRADLDAPHAPTAAAHWFGELVEHPDWSTFLAAPAVGHLGWSRDGTLLGGALCHPLDARRIEYVERVGQTPASIDWLVEDTRFPRADRPSTGWIATDAPRDGFVLWRRAPADHER